MNDLHLVPIAEIKAIVDTLADLGIDPLHMHVDGHKPTDIRPDVQLWMRYRTDFERTCEALGAKKVEVRNWQVGERRYSAEHDTDRRRLLIQCVSFRHHDDFIDEN